MDIGITIPLAAFACNFGYNCSVDDLSTAHFIAIER
jgi:hypothetical protein